MTAITELQKSRQADQVQINLDAAQGYSVTPNQGNVTPNVLQTQNILETMLAAKNAIPNIEPPSEDEIRHESWIASGVMGLLGAIVTGNAAGGIAIGMQAALALHDHGYDLRQRAECVGELHQQGYSARAIEQWYETGDNTELDKERQNMLSLAKDEAGIEMQSAQMSQADRHFNVQQKNANDRFYSGQEAAESRFERGLEAADKRAEFAVKAQGLSGLKQEAMERRQSLMKGATLDADQFKALARSRAAAYKAISDMRLGTPIGEQQLELMGQLIDAPNASVKLTQTHHISEGAAHGMIDRAEQYLNKAISGEPLTEEQAHELLDVINAGHAAQEQAYYEQVGSQASQITDPQEWKNFAIATGLSEVQLQRALEAYNREEDRISSVPFGDVGKKDSSAPKSGDSVSW
ncbi:hypothetical protein E0940_11055 [Salmonella enterica subsp. enterica serovar Mapo]|uniref:Uncharacterized protein n=1 Tax=Salmonella enterica subsp. enterica serovar Mapo TaxID=2564752 RepID=A0A5H7IGX0_SALET|nr:hypothetical protein [Salmonella enterica subsp. enterica serovar Mapo]